MKYASHYHGFHVADHGVPFAEFTAPFKTTGEAVYDAAASVGGAAVKVFKAAVAKYHEVQTVNALSELSERTLQDIGVHPSDIHFVAKKVAQDPNYNHRAGAR